MADLPTGTVTFLFTDLEGSTRLLQAHPAAYRAAVARHLALLRGAVEAHGGIVFETVGDAVYAAFARPTDAVAAALAGQRALLGVDWGELGGGVIKARMGLHTGEVEVQGQHYFGAPLYRCARLTATAHGGQTVLSAATAELVQDELPDGRLRDLGAHRLKDLARAERVYQLGDPELPAEFPPLRSLDARLNNLPRQLTPFVGRGREVAAVAEQVLRLDVPLLTLLGPGGIGKTRLALQAAAEVLDAPGPEGGPFPDGAWLVELAPLADPAMVPAAVAQVLGVREKSGRPLAEALRDHLRERRLLLVLDNCEHLLPAVAPTVAALLAAGPGVTVLATTREALRVAGEHEFPVPALRLHEPTDAARPLDAATLSRCEAVALFVERATAAEPRFAITDETAPAVVELCRRLDGLPLALELAAARVTLLPPRALLARLDRRLAVLTGGRRDAPARQQTIRGTIDWSHDLLTPEEQALFRRLAVFVGGCTLGAAEAVGGGEGDPPPDVLDGMASLVGKSLLRRDDPVGPAGDGAGPRFAMLETVREYALERLGASGEADTVRARHAEYVLRLAEAVDRQLHGPAQGALLDQLQQEHDNVRAALRWCVDHGDAARGLPLVTAVHRLWVARGYLTEGRRWLAALLALPDEGIPVPVRGLALRRAAELARHQGDTAAARALAAQRVRLQGEAGDPAGLALALEDLAMAARDAGEYDQARALLEASLATFRSLPEDRQGWHVGRALDRLGTVAHAAGDLSAARERYEESLALLRKHPGARHVAVWARHNLAALALDQGDISTARALATEALTARREWGDRDGLVRTLPLFAGVAAAEGQPERALRLAGAVAAAGAASEVALTSAESDQLRRWLASARRLLDEPTQAAAWGAGRLMTLEEAVTYALGLAPQLAHPPTQYG